MSVMLEGEHRAISTSSVDAINIVKCQSNQGCISKSKRECPLFFWEPLGYLRELRSPPFPNVAAALLRSPISVCNNADRLLWKFSNSGEYKVKNFIWKIKNHALPNLTNLRRHHMQVMKNAMHWDPFALVPISSGIPCLKGTLAILQGQIIENKNDGVRADKHRCHSFGIVNQIPGAVFETTRHQVQPQKGDMHDRRWRIEAMVPSERRKVSGESKISATVEGGESKEARRRDESEV
ncbi:uncharacterized protein G2W53_028498 [Senna tora]|uniref:Uncharacterized protein n=1 Tax=Senna tora TaxID=362788 RepID=A0A834TCF7_9FABA|nr:uncharacterized protein G2W53_028498 [Senna tora]